MVKVIDSGYIETLNQQAQQSERKRSHGILSESETDPVQRLCIVLEPESYVRPHIHTATDKWELLVMLQGSAFVLLFDDEGVVTDKIYLSSHSEEEGGSAIEIPPNTWHSLVATKNDTLVLEVKPGPNDPSHSSFASWAPENQSADSDACRKWFYVAEIGEQFWSQAKSA